MVQLSPVQPEAQKIQDPSVCRQVSGLQLVEHILEQFVPKYPLLQARGRNVHIHLILIHCI